MNRSDILYGSLQPKSDSEYYTTESSNSTMESVETSTRSGLISVDVNNMRWNSTWGTNTFLVARKISICSSI